MRWKEISKFIDYPLSEIVTKYDYSFNGKIKHFLWYSTKTVTQIKELPNGNLVAVHNNIINIWDLGRKEVIFTYEHTYHVNEILCLPDSNIISGHDNGDIIIHEYPALSLKEHKQFIKSLIALPNNTFASASSEFIKIWTIREVLVTINYDTGKILYHDGKLIGNCNMRIRIWNIKGDLITTLQGYTCKVSDMCIISNKLYTGDIDGHIKIWDLTTYECTFTSEKLNYPIVNLVPLFDNYVLTQTFDISLGLWYGDKHIVTKEYNYNIIGHFGDYIILLTVYGRFSIWNMNDHSIKVSKSNIIFNCMKVLSTGEVITGGFDGKLVFWE